MKYDDLTQSRITALAVNTSTTTNTAGVRADGYTHACFHIMATTGGGQTVSVAVQDSADNSTFASVSGISTLTISASTTNASRVILVEHAKVREYVRLRIIHTGSAVMSSAICRQQNQAQSLGTAPDVVF